MKASNRRRHERLPFDSELELRRDGVVHWIRALGRDLSRGGLSFTTSMELRVGDAVRLGVRSPNGDSWLLVGTVRHASRTGDDWLIGIELAASLTLGEVDALRRIRR
jgi:hypothetical protein